MADPVPVRPFRSRQWFAAPGRSDMAALYLERFMNYGITAEELRCASRSSALPRPAPTSPRANRIHSRRSSTGFARDPRRRRYPDGISRPPELRELSPADRRARTAISPISGDSRDSQRLSDRLRRADHGLRQDDAVGIMAASTIDIPAIALFRRPIRWMAMTRAGRVRARSFGKAPPTRCGEISEEEVSPRRERFGAFGGH